MKLREVKDSGGKMLGWWFYCPACKVMHWYRTVPDEGSPAWEFNGDMTKPTFRPSLLLYLLGNRCHLFVRNGQIEYCGDCTHEMRGQTVPLRDLEDVDREDEEEANDETES